MFKEDDEIQFLEDVVQDGLIQDDDDVKKAEELIKEVGEVEDKTDPPDKDDGKQKEDTEEDDRKAYSRRVNKRIDKLTYERNIEREARAKEREEFLAAQAKFQAEQDDLKAKLEELLQHRQKEVEVQTDQQLEQRKKELLQRKRDALEIGEYDEAANLDDELMDIKIQQREKKARVAEDKPAVKTQPESVRQANQEVPEAPKPEPVANIPQAQLDWAKNNQWIYDNTNQKSRIEKAQKVFDRMLLDEGFDIEDPDTFVELDRRLKRETPPPVGGVNRGEVVEPDKKTGFTQADRKKMIDWGLDPNDPAQRKEWLKNRR